MFWGKHPYHDCLRQLIARNPRLQQHAAMCFPASANPDLQMAKKFARPVRHAANASLDAQRRSIRELFACNKYPDFQLVENCLAGDANFGAMAVASELRGMYPEVSDIRKMLKSNRFYSCQALLRRFCAGLESGRFRGIKKGPPRPLPMLLTIAHEAYFRMTLYYTMSEQGHRDTPGTSDKRKSFFDKMCARVKQDRDEYAETAWALRQKNPDAPATQDTSDNIDPLQHGAIDISDEYY